MLDLPAEVIEALAHYRRLVGERGWDWGDEQYPEFFRWARFSLIGPVFEAYADTGDWAKAIRVAMGTDVPAGIVLVRIDRDGSLCAEPGPARPSIDGHPHPVDVVLDSESDDELALTVAGHTITLPARGASVLPITLDGGDPAFTVDFPGGSVRVDRAARPVAAAELRLEAPWCARWSVTDDGGGAWFPDGVPHKWDAHHRPFFHAREATVEVPAGPLRVVCTRGMEYERVEREVSPAAGESVGVWCEPERLVDPAADGWYGGDLHIHLNYSGDMVCTPADAARMQHGEGLHLANLTVGNATTSLVYDRELLEAFPGTDLPWSTEDAVARMGVEYRNDLLGHVHALGLDAPPSRYYSGHERSDRPYDWPPNKAACEELRTLGATIGYAHPALTDFGGSGGLDERAVAHFFSSGRSCEARELVADAALGVVDSVDLISPFNDAGAMFLYHRLLSCGLRLAATAGTDVFLSFAHGPGVASNPPGWGRVYAQLGGRELSVPAFQDAIRAGRTVVSNGPWLTLEVAGHGPGAVLNAAAGDQLELRATAAGAGAEELVLLGPDGPLASTSDGALCHRLTVSEPTWIAAMARGGGHPNTLDETVFAHTSPVYLDIAGRRVARAADARWCLALLERLERFVHKHGRFAAEHRDAQLGEFATMLDGARAFYRGVAAMAARPAP